MAVEVLTDEKTLFTILREMQFVLRNHFDPSWKDSEELHFVLKMLYFPFLKKSDDNCNVLDFAFAGIN